MSQPKEKHRAWAEIIRTGTGLVAAVGALGTLILVLDRYVW